MSAGLDLLEQELPPTKRNNDRPEATALVEVLKVLRNHSALAWCERQNTGAAKVGGRFVRFGGVAFMARNAKDVFCELGKDIQNA